MAKIIRRRGRYFIVLDNGDERVMTPREVVEYRKSISIAKPTLRGVRKHRGGRRMDELINSRIDEKFAGLKSTTPTIVVKKRGILVLNSSRKRRSMREVYLEENGYDID